MFTFILTVCLTAAWSLLYYRTVRYERKRFDALYKQAIDLNKDNIEQNKHLKKLKNENAELKEEIRNLKTQLKEQAVSKLKEGSND